MHARDGTAGLLPAFEPSAGWRRVAATDGRERAGWAPFVRASPGGRCRDAERVVPVAGRPDARAPAGFREAFPAEGAGRPADRIGPHRTPEHGSRPDMAGTEFGALARDPPERAGDRPAPERHLRARQQARSEAEVTAHRRFATADARIRPRKLHPTVDARRSSRAEGKDPESPTHARAADLLLARAG